METGLPGSIRACLFDLDGVLTQTATAHEAAWKATFDAYLAERAGRSGGSWRPFEDEDYRQFVDGRIRADGVRTFLGSRGITLPDGEPDDPPTAETVNGIGNRKNEAFLGAIERDGVETFSDGVELLRRAHDAGLRCAVVSASANAVPVLETTGLRSMVDAVIDGMVAAERGLSGKPAPDTFVAGADALGVPVTAAAVFEDAVSGVEAGRAGGFGFVVGVDRVGEGHADELRRAGADVVVTDLTRLGSGAS